MSLSEYKLGNRNEVMQGSQIYYKQKCKNGSNNVLNNNQENEETIKKIMKKMKKHV